MTSSVASPVNHLPSAFRQIDAEFSLFYGRVMRTFSALPANGKAAEIVRRILDVVSVPLALLAFLLFKGVTLFFRAEKTASPTEIELKPIQQSAFEKMEKILRNDIVAKKGDIFGDFKSAKVFMVVDDHMELRGIFHKTIASTDRNHLFAINELLIGAKAAAADISAGNLGIKFAVIVQDKQGNFSDFIYSLETSHFEIEVSEFKSTPSKEHLAEYYPLFMLSLGLPENTPVIDQNGNLV